LPRPATLILIKVSMSAAGAKVREFSPHKSVIPNFIACVPVT
jgi:hypothetical protein